MELPEVYIDKKEKCVRFKGKYVSHIPRAYEILSQTPPEEQKEKLVKILGFESLNGLEDYTKYYKIKKGDIVVDAGAHVGVFTQKFSEAVGENGLVLAVEPDFRALGMLTHNVAELSNVIILPYALWDCEDVVPFQYMDSQGGVGMGSLIYQFPYWHPTRAIRLDKLLEMVNRKYKRAITPRMINFIKMDIEGSEVRALGGMTETLKHVDGMAIAAYHRIDNQGNKSFKDVLTILDSKAMITRKEIGEDGEIVYANRY